MKNSTYARLFLSFGFLLFFTTSSFAQRTITGIVTDDNKEPMFGVAIIIKDTTIGTVTGENGKYSLIVPKKFKTLVFSFVGYQSKEIKVETSDIIDVKMGEPDFGEMVTLNNCFGNAETRSKYSQIIPSEYILQNHFNKGKIHDPIHLLRGKVAGLEIVQAGNDPNGIFTARIRGVNTYSGENKPQIMIDGVPYSSLNLLDPMDISSVDVIKDGANYGIRGLKGVLNFETKKAFNNSITFNTSISTEGLIRPMRVLTAREFVSNGGKDYDSSTDWRSLVTQKAQTQVYNLAWGKHFKNTDFRISSNYRNAEGVIKKTGFKQFNGRFYVQQRLLKDKIQVTAHAALTSRASQLTDGETYRLAHAYNPSAPIYDAKSTNFGGYFENNNSFDQYNPLSILEQTWYCSKNLAYSGNLNAEWQFLPSLKAVTTIAHENQDGILGHYYGKTAFFQGTYFNGIGYKTNNTSQSNYLNSAISYQKDFNSLHIKAIGGYEFQKFKDTKRTFNTRDFDKDATNFEDLVLGKKSVGDSLPPAEKTNFTNHTLIGFYGRAELYFDKTYFLSLGYRHDGSSRLGINKKWIPQPSINAGVDFAKLFDLSTINLLKARIGYSTTSAAPFQSNLSSRTFNFVKEEPYTYINQVENPNLAAEVKREWNAGLDFKLFGDRFYGSLDAYKNTVSDIISQSFNNLPGFGYATIWANTATLQNKGIELTLRSTPITRNFRWETGMTFTHNASRILSFTKGGLNYSFNRFGIGNQKDFRTGTFSWGCPEGVLLFREGDLIGNFIGPHFVSVNPTNGKLIMSENPDNHVGGYQNEGIIGNALPKLTMAWSNNVQYENFDFSFILRGATGFQILNEYRGFYEHASRVFNQVVTKYNIPNFKGDIPFSDRTLENGKFVKLDNITLGYTFNNLGAIKQLKLYLSADNLLTITKYSGSDPEPHYDYGRSTNYSSSYYSKDNYQTGVDGRKLPPQ